MRLSGCCKPIEELLFGEATILYARRKPESRRIGTGPEIGNMSGILPTQRPLRPGRNDQLSSARERTAGNSDIILTITAPSFDGQTFAQAGQQGTLLCALSKL